MRPKLAYTHLLTAIRTRREFFRLAAPALHFLLHERNHATKSITCQIILTLLLDKKSEMAHTSYMSNAATIEKRLDVAGAERFLRVRDWQLSRITEYGGLYFKGEFEVEIAIEEGFVNIVHVPSGDGVDVFTVADLERELVSRGAMEWECPYCGEPGGDPVEVGERYLYGADADGNRGEWREDHETRCSKCTKREM